MIQMRHMGVYVKNLDVMTEFYKKVFGMHIISEKVIQSDSLIQDLLGCKEVIITKMVTPYGTQVGSGDMLELLHYEGRELVNANTFISDQCIIHMGISVDNINDVVNKILDMGGKIYTRIHVMSNENKCCFACDPEGNWLELIERK